MDDSNLIIRSTFSGSLTRNLLKIDIDAAASVELNEAPISEGTTQKATDTNPGKIDIQNL